MSDIPLTPEQGTFAAENHGLVLKFLNENHLPVDEFYDVVIFGYLKAVKEFCKAHQSAYDDARPSLQELQFYRETMLESQKQMLASIGENNHTMYLSDHSNLTISVRDIEKQIKKSHFAFIHSIVRHFEEIYHIVLDEGDIETALLPKQSGDRWRDGYEEEMIQYALNRGPINLVSRIKHFKFLIPFRR